MTKDGRPAPKRRVAVGLATKLLLITMVVVVGVALTLAARATSALDASLTRSFESKGEAIALALAAATEQNVGSDISTVQGAVDANKVIHGVAYIYIQDSHGHPYVHTFTPTFPPGLETTNPIALGEVPSDGRVKIARDLDYAGTGGTTVRSIDVAAPVAGGALGTVHVGMDPAIIKGQIAAMRLSMLVWGGAVAALGILFSLALTLLTVIRPIRELTRVTTNIVDKGDLTQKIHVRSSDEIGLLAATFESMVEKLRSIPNGLRASTQLLATSVSHLRASTAEQSQTVTRQAAALQETQVTAQEIKQTSLLAAQKAEAVLKYAERAEVISRTGEAAVEQSVAALTDIRARVDEIAQRIAGLGERTMQVAGITETVKDLADQSNMLALNAAIEAVRSGEHGKGFAVVAREMRSLADQSSQATKRVREILEDISGAIRGAVTITDNGARHIDAGLAQVKTSGEKLTELASIVKENSSAVRQISAAVGQQNAGIAQIFGAVIDQNKMMETTVENLGATDNAVEALKGVSEQLVAIVGQFRV